MSLYTSLISFALEIFGSTHIPFHFPHEALEQDLNSNENVEGRVLNVANFFSACSSIHSWWWSPLKHMLFFKVLTFQLSFYESR